MPNIYTVKPTLSDRALAAMTLAAVEFAEHDGGGSYEEAWLDENLGEAYLQNMEKLKDPEFAKAAILQLRASSLATKLAPVFRRRSVEIYMNNIPESIAKGFLSFTHLGISKGDYVLVLTPAFTLANYVAHQTEQTGSSADQAALAAKLFDEFKKQPATMNAYFTEVTRLNQMIEYRQAASSLLDSTLRQSFEGKQIESVVKLLLENGFCQFELVD